MVSKDSVGVLEIVFETVVRNHFLPVLDQFSSDNLLEFYKISDNFDFKKVIVEDYIRRHDAKVEIAKKYLLNEKDDELKNLWLELYAEKDELSEREKDLISTYVKIKEHHSKIEFLERYIAKSDSWENAVILVYKLEDNSYTKISILQIYAANVSGIEKAEELIALYKDDGRFEAEFLRLIKQKSQELSQEEIKLLRGKYSNDKYLLEIWRGVGQKSLSFNKTTDELELNPIPTNKIPIHTTTTATMCVD